MLSSPCNTNDELETSLLQLLIADSIYDLVKWIGCQSF